MAQPTSLAVSVDKDEYSINITGSDKVTVTVVPAGTGWNNEVCSVELIKARRGRDEVVGTYYVALNETLGLATATFTLKNLVDSTHIPKVHRGDYFVKVKNTGFSTVIGTSRDFAIGLITVDSFKDKYLFGLSQSAFEKKDVKLQPSDITGVSVSEVSKMHEVGWFPLSYNFDPGPVTSVVAASGTVGAGSSDTIIVFSGSPFTLNQHVNRYLNIGSENIVILSNTTSTITVRTPFSSAPSVSTAYKIYKNASIQSISWCGGPLLTITNSKNSYLLRKGSSDDYLVVDISFSNLPTVSKEECLFVDSAILPKAKIREFIEDATSWVEKVVLGMYLEPTRVVTEDDTGSMTYEAGSTDIPSFTGVDWDEVVDAVTYYRPNPSHWLYLKMPYRPVLKIEKLYGKMANVNIINIDLNWIEFNANGGLIELIPSNLSTFNVQGLLWAGAINGLTTMPNFWHFKALVGFKETPKVLIELVSIQAAIMALTVLGQAYRGGLASSSISRDGISEGVSYLSSGPNGVYSGAIATHAQWIADNLPKIRSSFLGPNLISMN